MSAEEAASMIAGAIAANAITHAQTAIMKSIRTILNSLYVITFEDKDTDERLIFIFQTTVLGKGFNMLLKMPLRWLQLTKRTRS